MRTGLRRSLLAMLAAVLLSMLATSCILFESRPGPGAPTVLLSIDSTWWNRLQLNRFTYLRALHRAGLNVRLVRFSDLKAWSQDEQQRLLEGIDGLVLSGGGDVDPRLYGGSRELGLDVKPLRDRFELDLLAAARERNLPVLGICRGAQLMNVALGGSLLSLREDSVLKQRHKRVTGGHPVSLEPDSLLADIYGTERLETVRSYHGQAVDRPGVGVRVTAHAPDGVAEAIEVETGTDMLWIGVQWHAETQLFDDEQQRLFDAFAGQFEPSPGTIPATATP